MTTHEFSQVILGGTMQSPTAPVDEAAVKEVTHARVPEPHKTRLRLCDY